MNKKNDRSNVFVIVLFAIIVVFVLFFPKIYGFIENMNLPKIEKSNNQSEEKNKVVDSETLEDIHRPIMRNSVYDANTYYSLDKFTIQNMSNNDILYNAFMGIEEVVLKDSNRYGTCTNIAKELNKDYIELRIKNILGKQVNYTLQDFTVPEGSDSKYVGTWTYDSSNSRYIYNGLCESKKLSTKYYNLEEFIKAEYDNRDILAYYYVGFAKVEGNNYTIYKDAKMTVELQKGEFTTLDDLNSIYKSINSKNKNIYKYTFKDTLCSYNEYCLYEGKWVNEL